MTCASHPGSTSSNAAVRRYHEDGLRIGTHAGPIHDCFGCSDTEPSIFVRSRNFQNIESAVRYAQLVVSQNWGCLVSIYERADLRPDAYARGLWEWEDKHIASEPFDDPRAIIAGVALFA